MLRTEILGTNSHTLDVRLNLRGVAIGAAYRPQLRIAGIMCSVTGAMAKGVRGGLVRASAGVATSEGGKWHIMNKAICSKKGLHELSMKHLTNF